MKRDWQTSDLDINFLLESGLLFEINRQLLHPFGLAMTVVVSKGKKTLSFRDYRSEPDKAVFDKETTETGRKKFGMFLKTFGYAQMEIRSKKLGKSVQHVERWV